MAAPIDRNTQIELMRNAQERMTERGRAWMKVASIRDVLKRPPAPQDGPAYKQTVRRVARCG